MLYGQSLHIDTNTVLYIAEDYRTFDESVYFYQFKLMKNIISIEVKDMV